MSDTNGPTNDPRDKTWAEGHSKYWDDVPATSNPYEKYSEDWSNWNEGWTDAQSEDGLAEGRDPTPGIFGFMLATILGGQ